MRFGSLEANYLNKVSNFIHNVINLNGSEVSVVSCWEDRRGRAKLKPQRLSLSHRNGSCGVSKACAAKRL